MGHPGTWGPSWNLKYMNFVIEGRISDADLLALYDAVNREARRRKLCTKCGARYLSFCHCENDE